ncbi:MAG: ester cyclase [Candidatus Rokubacteria bacterium]|nr:ester cyclase [Candidatus Rokubacteria bacterium]
MPRTAFLDLRFVVEGTVAEGDKILARVGARGRQGGAFMGMPPTYSFVEVTKSMSAGDSRPQARPSSLKS